MLREKRNSHSWKKYQKLSKLVKESLENSHRTYVDNILNTSISEDPKMFYSYIKQKKSGQRNTPVLKTNGKLVSEPVEIAEALNSQYISQFTRKPTGDLPNIDGQSVPPMSDIVFTVPGIVKLLSNHNPAKASGPDIVPARILKLASMGIVLILCIIFQQSYNTGPVPLG